MNQKLSDYNVDYIRHSNETDAQLARVFRVSRLAILRARTGRTFRHVKTKPKIKSRQWCRHC